jgi:hypothetical protein
VNEKNSGNTADYTLKIKSEKEYQQSWNRWQDSRKSQRNQGKREKQQTVPRPPTVPYKGKKMLKTHSQDKPNDSSDTQLLSCNYFNCKISPQLL